jgi:UDP-N-acetylglucosamine 4-epimerase
MTTFNALKTQLLREQYSWCITGVAGFIGSNLLESLLQINQKVIGLDNFSSGFQRNLDEVRHEVSPRQWANFKLLNGDIRNFNDCKKAVKGVDFVLHQAALASISKSLEDPILSNACNISGMLNMLTASRDESVKAFVYAASSSTDGEYPSLTIVDKKAGLTLSPFAISKYVNELYGEAFETAYGFKSIGLRYFNVFGPRQASQGAYTAVIPLWTSNIVAGDPLFINGDGETSRDFCYVANTVQANILAALAQGSAAGQIYNVACNVRTTLNELKDMIYLSLLIHDADVNKPNTIYRESRAGDVKHSQAEITKAQTLLGYEPSHQVQQGIDDTMPWYLHRLQKTQAGPA